MLQTASGKVIRKLLFCADFIERDRVSNEIVLGRCYKLDVDARPDGPVLGIKNKKNCRSGSLLGTVAACARSVQNPSLPKYGAE